MSKRFLNIEHGLDNYEEYFDVSEIVFVKINHELIDTIENTWVYITHITFRSGVEKTVRLSEKGYGVLIEKLTK